MIAPALAAALAAVRPQLNRRIDEVRRSGAAFDGATLGAFIESAVDAVAQAVAAHDPSRVTLTVTAAIDTALQLGVADPAQSSRTALVRETWQALAAPCAALIAAQPAQVLGMLSNAALHIDRNGGRSAQWRRDMASHTAELVSTVGSTPNLDTGSAVMSMSVSDTDMDTSSTIPQLAALGQLLAWRAGLAHFREGALAAAAVLPEPLALAALRVPPGIGWAEAAAAMQRDPWWGDKEADIATGAFTGFGGAFAGPPAVVPCDDGFIVDGRARHHLLVADRFGAVLQPADADDFLGAASAQGRHPEVQLTGSSLRVGARTIALDLPPDGLRAVCNRHTVAVTSPYTHAIRLLPLP